MIFGQNIDQEYESIPYVDITSTYENIGVPSSLLMYNPFESLEKQLNPRSEKKRLPLKKKENSEETSSQVCKRIYYDCINKILSYGIQIYSIVKDLKKFTNGYVSSCGGDNIVYIFYCGKNNCKFIIQFEDDCDCIPGILCVKDIEMNGVQIDMYCDIFCQNTSTTQLTNFLNLIDSNTYQEYIDNRFGALLRLPHLLTEQGFNVSNGQLIKPNSATINKYDFTFILDLGECSIIPYDNKAGNYTLYISPTLKDVNDKSRKHYYHHEREKIDINTFNHDLRKKSYKFKYQNETDLPELVKCISSYLNYKNNNYGYLDLDNKFYNDQHVKVFIKQTWKAFENSRNIKLNYFSNCNNYYGPDFDIFINLTLTDTFMALTRKHLSDYSYPFDYYAFKFYYNRQKNIDQCILLIYGKYYDLTQLANHYYQGENTFDDKTYDCHLNDIAPSFKFEGTFNDCFNRLKSLINTLIEINLSLP